MAIIGGDQGKAGESKGSGRKADDLRLSCLCLLLLLENLFAMLASSTLRFASEMMMSSVSVCGVVAVDLDDDIDLF